MQPRVFPCRYRATAALVFTSCALAILGCGGGAAREATQLSQQNILEAIKPLRKAAVTRAEIDAAPDSAGVKTLLQLWSTLQLGHYQLAASFFDHGSPNFIGAAQLIAKLRSQGLLWPSTKPAVIEATATRGSARVTFRIRNLLGQIGAVVIRFRKRGSAWKATYFSVL